MPREHPDRVSASRPLSHTRKQDLIVIGGGAAGLSAASMAGRLGARITLIEAHHMGGDCLYTGCIPSKALLAAAAHAQSARTAHRFGIRLGEVAVDFEGVRAHIQQAITTIAPEDSPERYQSLGVQVLTGEATVVDPHTVRVGSETLTTRSLILATGAAPVVPELTGLADAHWVTSETVWALESCPRRLLVLGGGAVGCELGQAFARLGSQVTLVESGTQILGREPIAASDCLARVLRREGMRILTDTHALRIEGRAPETQLVVSHADGSVETLDFDVLLVAVGRTPRQRGYEALTLAREPDGRVATNAFLATSQPGVYAAGDVSSALQFTHVAGQQGVYAALNALFRPFVRLKWNQSPVPRVVYTDPEVASVIRPGLDPSDLAEILTLPLQTVNRSVTDGEEEGCVVLGVDRRGRCGSATLVMPHAGEIIPELALAIQERLPLNRILALIHPYPTYAEINRLAAARWREAHLSSAGRALAGRVLSLFRNGMFR